MSDNISKIVGDRIKLIRLEQGLTQEEVAYRAGIDQSHLGRLERGERNPSLAVIEKVIYALGITFEDLFKYILPPAEENDNKDLSLIMNKLTTLSKKEQKLVLIILNALFKLMGRPDK
ncbi:helix-turn-helix domain-containing protein [Ruminiclostridium cellobioparum]|uniref:helix-turn-helix domain-containing protein n=1 Tax=Ruminiclostridium cellobioparum TaxID=29355 RepID=UPI00047F61D0|nr:helix-turn-helix transcriptional regulator [Ruminiclostridium cellobioparum]